MLLNFKILEGVLKHKVMEDRVIMKNNTRLIISREYIKFELDNDGFEAIVLYTQYDDDIICIEDFYRINIFQGDFEYFEDILKWMISCKKTTDEFISNTYKQDDIQIQIESESHYEYETHTSWDTVDGDLYIKDTAFHFSWDDFLGYSCKNCNFDDLFDFLLKNNIFFKNIKNIEYRDLR